MTIKIKKFQRKTEDFVCENCSFRVKGNGYTNHCPKCLYSKHVDLNPGDRAAQCQGLMRPIATELKNDQYVLIHECVKCGAKKKNKTSSEDSFEEILKIARTNPTF